MRRNALPLLLAALAALAFAATPAAAGRYLVEWAGATTELQTIEVGGNDLVDIEDVARAFRFEIVRDGRREGSLRAPTGDIDVRAGRALVTVAGQPVLLRAEVRRKGGRLYVPIDFITRAVARLLETEARHDPTARVIRFDPRTEVVTCEEFADRTRVTLQLDRPAAFSEVVRDGRRRILVVTNQELPSQVGGCRFNETLADLEVRPTAGETRITFFVGDRFASLKVYDLPDTRQLVFDFFNDAGLRAELQSPPPRVARPSDVFDTVAIDAGHGGEDDGARGPAGLAEKDLTLAVARELARRLRARGLEVVLTRQGDETLGLQERTAIANRARADLFLSIHANATVVPNAWGAETYFLSLEATDEASRTVAALENDATGLRSRGAAVDDDLELLLWDMAQQQYLSESNALGEVVQAELNELAGTRDRGVKQANFAVLRGATMPAVLVEVGFLSNPREERRMATAEFREATAEALLRAIVAFRDQRAARAR